MEKILWADDEIDLLKPHIMFLKTKGYDIVTVSNGQDVVAFIFQKHYVGLEEVYLVVGPEYLGHWIFSFQL